MNCQQVRKWKETYVDGGLTAAQRQALEAHLATCTHCAARVALARRIQQELGPTLHQAIGEPHLRPAAESRIRARLWEAMESTRPAAAWRRWVTRGLAPTLALATVVLLALAAWPLFTPRLPATQQAFITPPRPDTPVLVVVAPPSPTPLPAAPTLPVTTLGPDAAPTPTPIAVKPPAQTAPPTLAASPTVAPRSNVSTATRPASPPAAVSPTRPVVSITPAVSIATGATPTAGPEAASAGEWARYLAGESVTCLALCPAPGGARRDVEVWAGTSAGQVVRVRPADAALARYALSSPAAPVSSLTVDPAGRVWAATMGQGLFALTPTDTMGAPAWRQYTVANSGLPSDMVSVVAVDAAGTVWCGADMAIGRLILPHTDILTGAVVTPAWQSFAVPIPAGGSAPHQVTALATEGAGALWVGLWGNDRAAPGRSGNGGLFRLTVNGDAPAWERVLADDVGVITAIFVGPGGQKWVAVSPADGARGGGVVVWDGRSWTLYEAQGAGMPSRTILGVAVDARQRTWIATDNGLVVYAGTRRAIYQASVAGLLSNRVTAIVPDESGAWLATDAGLNHLTLR